VRKTWPLHTADPPAHERALERVVWRCRELYTAGLQARKTAWERCHISGNFARRSARLPSLTLGRPEYRARHAQVLQDVLHRLEKT
jgi:putative transposase